MGEIIVEKGCFGMTNVEISRRLRGEPGHDTLISVQKRNVVVSTAFLALGSLFVLCCGIQRLKGRCGPRTELFQEGKPPSQVDKSPLSDSRDSDTVSAKGTPQGNVSCGKRISDDEGPEKEVGIKALEQRIKGLEVEGSKGIKLRKPLVLLVVLLDEWP